MPEKRKFPVTGPIKHNGERYAVGDFIELSERAAERLRAAGFIGEAIVVGRDDTATCNLLLLVGCDVPLEVIGSWSDDTVAACEAWAGAVHLSASDNDVAVPDRPDVLAPYTADAPNSSTSAGVADTDATAQTPVAKDAAPGDGKKVNPMPTKKGGRSGKKDNK